MCNIVIDRDNVRVDVSCGCECEALRRVFERVGTAHSWLGGGSDADGITTQQIDGTRAWRGAICGVKQIEAELVGGVDESFSSVVTFVGESGGVTSVSAVGSGANRSIDETNGGKVNDLFTRNNVISVGGQVCCGSVVANGVGTNVCEKDNVSEIVQGDVSGKKEVLEVVSETTLANRAKRARRKARKVRKQNQSVEVEQVDVPEWRRKTKNGFVEEKKKEYRGAFEICDESVRRRLVETRARRLIAENEAAAVKAESMVQNSEVFQKLQKKKNNLRTLQVNQSIELVRSQDVDKLKKRHEVQVMRDTEVSKVQVERAFGTLATSGNVPTHVGGSAQTIVSGTISPNSSVSEQEVRAMQKKCLDQELQIAELVAKLREAKADEINDGTYSVGITVDSNGDPIADLGDGYCGYIGRDGRFHQGENYDLW